LCVQTVDLTLVTHFPRERQPVYVPDIEDGLKKVIAMDWETLIPGHPGPAGKQTGTKEPN
jgi:hypothetical protein